MLRIDNPLISTSSTSSSFTMTDSILSIRTTITSSAAASVSTATSSPKLTTPPTLTPSTSTSVFDTFLARSRSSISRKASYESFDSLTVNLGIEDDFNEERKDLDRVNFAILRGRFASITRNVDDGLPSTINHRSSNIATSTPSKVANSVPSDISLASSTNFLLDNDSIHPCTYSEEYASALSTRIHSIAAACYAHPTRLKNHFPWLQSDGSSIALEVEEYAHKLVRATRAEREERHRVKNLQGAERQQRERELKARYKALAEASVEGKMKLKREKDGVKQHQRRFNAGEPLLSVSGTDVQEEVVDYHNEAIPMMFEESLREAFDKVKMLTWNILGSIGTSLLTFAQYAAVSDRPMIRETFEWYPPGSNRPRNLAI